MWNFEAQDFDDIVANERPTRYDERLLAPSAYGPTRTV